MEKLKYLFEAQYKDDSLFVQSENDTSTKDLKRSSFFDVNQNELKKFYLVENIEKNQPQKVFSVNLIDGSFEVNGVQIFMHDDKFLKDFRLIFFRRNKIIFNQCGNDLPIQDSKIVTYRIGWQTNDENGKNVQQVMEFN